MHIYGNGLKIYRLAPEEVEELLSIQYGSKLVAVNIVKREKQNQRRANYGNGVKSRG